MQFKAQWKIRRAIIIMTLIACALIVGKLLVIGPDSDLSQTLANGAFMLAGAVIGSYVFGAAWDDQNERRAMISTAVAQPAAPAAPDGEE